MSARGRAAYPSPLQARSLRWWTVYAGRSGGFGVGSIKPRSRGKLRSVGKWVQTVGKW